MMAIERAKQKVMELKAQKLAQHQQFLPKPSTIAQTAQKGTGRVAHTNTTITSTQQVCKLFMSLNFMCGGVRLFVYFSFFYRLRNRHHPYWNPHQQKSPTIFELNITI